MVVGVGLSSKDSMAMTFYPNANKERNLIPNKFPGFFTFNLEFHLFANHMT